MLHLGKRAHLHEIRLGAQTLEDVPRGLVLEARRLLVAEQATRLADEHPRPGDFIRRLEVVPRLACLAQRDESGLSIAFCELYRAPCVRNHRSEHRALVSARQLFELETRTTRALDVADGEHDLDE